MKKTVETGDGRKVTVIGTAHVSQESVEEVTEVLEEVSPDLVGVELDEKRYSSLKDRDGWKEMNVADAIRGGRGPLLFINLMLSLYQRKIGIEEGIEPGQELLEAVEQSEDRGIEFKLLDRDISETFERIRDQMGLIEKLTLLGSFFVRENDIELEELKDEDIIGRIVRELEDDFPAIKNVLLDERNSYMAEELLEEDFEHAVVVVGAAHLEGIADQLENGSEPIKKYSKGFNFPALKIVKWGIPALIIAGLAYSFFQIGFSTGIDATRFWILSNGLMAALGAIIARSHISTWIVSFLSAPLTSLYPLLGAGMVASYFEGKFYPPTVDELESIAYIDSYSDLWSNQVGRVLLTLVFVTAGSALATFVSAGYIAYLIAAI